MTALQHHKLDSRVQPDSQCVFTLGRGELCYFSSIVYEVAVEDYLERKLPLVAAINGVSGAYNSNAILSVRKLTKAEESTRDRKAEN